jgi:hypothetical protein
MRMLRIVGPFPYGGHLGYRVPVRRLSDPFGNRGREEVIRMKAARVIGLVLVLAAAVALAGVALAGKASKPAHPRQVPRAHVARQNQEPSESVSESEAESEASQSGEPAQGHHDPPGQDVNHECTGNCHE